MDLDLQLDQHLHRLTNDQKFSSESWRILESLDLCSGNFHQNINYFLI